MIISLPTPFCALEDLTQQWVLPSEQARMAKRFASTYEELCAFYDRVTPLLPAILDYLSKVKPAEIVPADGALLSLTFSLAEVSIAVEKVKAVRSEAVYPAERLEFLHERSV